MKISEVIASFETNDSKYKRDQVSFAIKHQQEITPYLVRTIKKIF